MTTQAFRPLKVKAPAQPAISATAAHGIVQTSLAGAQQQQQQQQAQVQAQTTAQSQITFAQSLSVVRTLMSVSFGCIAYLRGLLPEENFTDNSTTHTLAADLRTAASQGDGKKPEKGALKVKTIKRNYSPEGDKLMDYLEKGVMDAIEKKYLRALVMSIYMNPDDPANVIETYTFNFSYPTLADGTTIPVLDVKSTGGDVPMAAPRTSTLLEAAQDGPMTVGAVKKAVRHMIKQLILLTQNLADLPRKRCLSFKTFYEEHTPDNYQPPMFREADLEKERLYFATQSRNQAPDLSTVSKVDTGFHGVQLTIRSIIDLLPASSEAGDGLPYGQAPEGKTPAEIRETMRKDDEALERDELARKYLWNAEEEVWKGREEDLDAEGEPDPDVPPSQVPASPPVFGTAFAIRKAGDIYEPIAKATRRQMLKGKGQDADEETDSAHGVVVPDESPTEHRRLSSVLAAGATTTSETQPVDPALSLPTQVAATANVDESAVLVSAMDVDPAPAPAGLLAPDGGSLIGSALPTVDQASFTQAQSSTSKEGVAGPSTKVERERNAPASDALSTDKKKSSRKAKSQQPANVPSTPPRRSQRTRSRTELGGASARQPSRDSQGHGADWDPCWCGDEDDGLDMVGCDGPGCRRFMHVWCVGGRSADNFEAGERFLCESCRLQADPRTAAWPQARFDECRRLFQELALFRRALRVAYDETLPSTLDALAKRLHCSSPDAKGIFERLLREGFIKLIRTKSHKKGMSHVTKDHYVVNRTKSTDSQVYFNRHDRALEDRLYQLRALQAHGGPDVTMDAEPASLSRASSILSDVPDDAGAAAPSERNVSSPVLADESQTQPATYPFLAPAAAGPLSESIYSSVGGFSAGQGTQFLPGPPQSLASFQTPKRSAPPPTLDRGEGGRSSTLRPRPKKTLARAFDLELEGRKRARTSRVGVARSTLDLTV